mgnify:CR=1 FL=1
MTRRVRTAAGHRRDGFALLIVLWTLAGLSLLVSIVIATAGAELRATYALRGSARMQAAADGAVGAALFHALDGATHWAPDGRPHVTRTDGLTTTTWLRDEGGLVNPNTAPRPLLAALLRECGATADQAASIAAHMAEWRSSAQGDTASMRARYLAAGLSYRPPRAAFQTVDEVGLVLGMTPALLRAVGPHLSVTQSNDPDPGLADSVVRRALHAAGTLPAPPAGGNRPDSIVVEIAVRNGQGGRATRQATILLTPGIPLGRVQDVARVVRLTRTISPAPFE